MGVKGVAFCGKGEGGGGFVWDCGGVEVAKEVCRVPLRYIGGWGVEVCGDRGMTVQV